MDAQYVIFNRFMGRRPQETEQRLVAHMQATQSDDGSWPLYHGGPGHLSTTIEAYFAHEARRRVGRRIRRCGARASSSARTAGSRSAGVFTRTFLAYFGQFPWWGLPAMPVELVLLPPWFPINIYAMSSWARETVVPLTVLMAKQPRVADPGRSAASRSCGSRRRRRASLGFPRSPRAGSRGATSSSPLDWVLQAARRSPWKPWRRRALARAERVDPRRARIATAAGAASSRRCSTA